MISLLTSPGLQQASDLLAVLALARDPEALKANLDAASAELLAVKAASEEAAAAALRAQADASAALAQANDRLAEAHQAAADAQRERMLLSQANEETNRMRTAMNDERTRFDFWMADQRAELNRGRDAVSSREDQCLRREADVAAARQKLAEEAAAIERVRAAAEALKAEYEAKLAALKNLTA